MIRFSKYLRCKQINSDIVGLYSPFGHEFCYISTRDKKFLDNHDFSMVSAFIKDDLQNRNFLVGDDFEKNILRKYLPPAGHIREMWLVIEQACNMACQYCVTEGNVQEPANRLVIKEATKKENNINGIRSSINTMNYEVALAAVNKFEKFLQKEQPIFPRITLYGGEPLLNWPLIKKIVPHICKISYPGQARTSPVQILIITNGQILNDEIIAFFVKHRVSVSVSVDGLQKHHDDQRVTISGRGTFKRTVSSLLAYKKAGLNVGICTTIGSHNVKDLAEIAEYFANEFALPVELQVPFDIPYNGGNKTSVPMIDAAPYTTDAYECLRKHGLLEGLLGRRMSQVMSGQFHHRDCSAVGGQLVVAPDGSMGPCHAFTGQRKYFSGNILDENSYPWDNPAFHEWSRRQPVNMPDCHGCSAIAICGGGCPYNAYICSGSIWQKDPQQCEYMHYLIDWMIDDMWKQRIHERKISEPMSA